jgi:hypothetical protein
MRVHPSHAHQSCLQNGTCGRLKKASCSCPIRPYYLDCWCITCIQVGIHEDKAGPMALPRCAPGLSSSSHRHCGSMEHVTAQGEQHGLKPCFRIQFSLFDSLLSGKTLAHILPEKQSGNWLLWWASWLLGYFCILWALCLKGWSHWPQKSLSLSVGFAFFFCKEVIQSRFPGCPALQSWLSLFPLSTHASLSYTCACGAMWCCSFGTGAHTYDCWATHPTADYQLKASMWMVCSCLQSSFIKCYKITTSWMLLSRASSLALQQLKEFHIFI